MGSNGPLGMEVTGLHTAGSTMAGRSGDAHAHANGVKTGVDDAATAAGHPVVRAALSALLTDHILDPATKLPNLIGGGGESIANVAATGRSSDNEAARDVKTYADATDLHATTLTRQINTPA